jgi:hypothetical protein
VDSIFIFCGNKKRHEEWAEEWSKTKGVFTEIKPICETLKQAEGEGEGVGVRNVRDGPDRDRDRDRDR